VRVHRFCGLAAMVAATAGVGGCTTPTGPNGVRLVVAPPDTGVVAGGSYQLRVQLFDPDGRQLPRSAYSPSFAVCDTTIARVTAGDTVRTMSPGACQIVVTVHTRHGDLQSTVRVLSGVVVH
jgi:hypothetical protein